MEDENARNYMTGNDLLALPEIKWLWPGYIPIGFVTIVVGQAGSGKSAFVQDLAHRGSQKTEWPNEEIISESFDTLWIDSEGAKPILADRIRGWQMKPANFILPPQEDLYKDFTLVEKSIIQVEQILKEQSPKLVVIDSLCGVHRRDEKTANEMKDVLDVFQKWASSYGVAVVVIHHLNKENQAFKQKQISLDRVRGSTQIVASARSSIAVDVIKPNQLDDEQSETDSVNRIYQIKNNLGPVQEEPLHFTINDQGLTYLQDLDFQRYMQSTGQVEKACRLITERLNFTDSPIPAREMKELFKENKISQSSWKRAKFQLGVESKKVGKEWVWIRP